MRHGPPPKSGPPKSGAKKSSRASASHSSQASSRTSAQKPGQRARADARSASKPPAPTRPKSSAHPSGKSPFKAKGKTIHAEAGMTLAKWVAFESGETISGREAKRLLEAGYCRVNGRVETFASRVLAVGDVVDLALPERREKWVAQRFERERVVYEDDVMLAYDKPHGLAVVAPDGKHNTENLATLVAAEVPGAEPVHRIDADTTGIVLFAKTRPVQSALEEAFKAHTVEKVYLAIVRGHPRHEGTHRSYLVKVDAGLGFERWVGAQGMRDTRGAPAQSKTAGREAITRWRLVERLGLYASLLEVRPETGRHHQIRLHMSELGHGLLGDTRYGDRRDPVAIARHMLHAGEIAFTHPVSQKKLVLKASLPADFKAAMAKLKSQ